VNPAQILAQGDQRPLHEFTGGSLANRVALWLRWKLPTAGQPDENG
jgi:hypothetical protein